MDHWSQCVGFFQHLFTCRGKLVLVEVGKFQNLLSENMYTGSQGLPVKPFLDQRHWISPLFFYL